MENKNITKSPQRKHTSLGLGVPARGVVVLAIGLVSLTVTLPRRTIDVLLEERTDELLRLFLE